MFEISQLKEKTLLELQEIAKTIGAKKYSQLKKLDLVYAILDIQAATPIKTTQNDSSSESKAKRKRIVKKAKPIKDVNPSEPIQVKEEVTLEPKVETSTKTNTEEPKQNIPKTNPQTIPNSYVCFCFNY